VPKVLRAGDDRTCPSAAGASMLRVMRHRSLRSQGLPALQATLAVGGVYGAAGLVFSLDGFDMPVDWLSPLPLSSWVLPGLALLVGVALPLGAAAAAGWRDDPRAGALSRLAVGLLLAWLALQLAVMGLRAPVQVVTLALALLLLVLTRRAR
jgi:hypothetical protein